MAAGNYVYRNGNDTVRYVVERYGVKGWNVYTWTRDRRRGQHGVESYSDGGDLFRTKAEALAWVRTKAPVVAIDPERVTSGWEGVR